MVRKKDNKDTCKRAIRCPECSESFNNRQTLWRHRRKDHPETGTNRISVYQKVLNRSNNTSNTSCEICPAVYSTRGGLLKHMKRCHPDEKITKFPHKQYGVKEIGDKGRICGCLVWEQGEEEISRCKRRFQTMFDLCAHTVEEHQMPAKVEEMTFDSEQEFLEWKLDIEEKTHMQFAKGKSVQTSSHGYHHFFCARSGPQRLRPVETRVRANKANKSVKLGFHCTAFIFAKYLKSGLIEVSACLYHTGHETGEQAAIFRRIQPEQKCKIIDLITEQKSMAEILAFFKTKENGNEYYMPKLTAQDVRNVIAKLPKMDRKKSIMAKYHKDISFLQDRLKSISSLLEKIELDETLNEFLNRAFNDLNFITEDIQNALQFGVDQPLLEVEDRSQSCQEMPLVPVSVIGSHI